MVKKSADGADWLFCPIQIPGHFLVSIFHSEFDF
jgi:hypothetical protein